MSDPLLSYETPPADRPTGRRTAAWIATLVLGILHCLGGLCFGLGSGMVVVFMGTAPGGRPRDFGIVVAVMSAILLYILGSGILLIVGAFRVRRGSRGWAVYALVVSAMHAGLIVLMVAVGVIAIVSGSGRDKVAALGLLLYLISAGMNMTATILLFRALRDLRRRHAETRR